MKAVIGKIGEIDQFGAWAFGQFFIKSLTQVFVVQSELDVIQQSFDIFQFPVWIDVRDGSVKQRRENIGYLVPFGIF